MRRAKSWSRARLVVALLVGAWAVTLDARAGDDDGASLFQSSCAGCHDRAQALERVDKYPSREELDAYLSTHFAQNPEIRGPIIDYLLTLRDASDNP